MWQNENDVKLAPLYNEGLCNLGSYYIYAHEASDLSKKLIDKLEKNPDPVYGNGFRLMKKKWEKAGSWNNFIAEILANKNGFEESLWKKIFG